jgi:hypothetical protein
VQRSINKSINLLLSSIKAYVIGNSFLIKNRFTINKQKAAIHILKNLNAKIYTIIQAAKESVLAVANRFVPYAF